MNYISSKQVKEVYGNEILALCYMILDQFNHNDVMFYHYDRRGSDFDLYKKIRGVEDEEAITLFNEIPDHIVEIAYAIARGKIRNAAHKCKKNNLALNISKLLDNALLGTKDGALYLGSGKLHRLLRIW